MTASNQHSVQDDIAKVREALNFYQPAVHDPPCEHGACFPHAALARIEEQYEDAKRKLSCGYDTGTGTNCGECLDCLKVNWHFAQEAVGNLKEQLEAYRAAFDKLDHAIGDLDDFSENVSHELKAAYPASEPESAK